MLSVNNAKMRQLSFRVPVGSGGRRCLNLPGGLVMVFQ